MLLTELMLVLPEVSHNAPSPQASPKPSPQPSPKFVRRRNSAPGTDDIISGTFLDGTNIPQTRSSTSLQVLLNTGALPRRLSEELFGVKLIIAKIMNMFFYLLFFKEE